MTQRVALGRPGSARSLSDGGTRMRCKRHRERSDCIQPFRLRSDRKCMNSVTRFCYCSSKNLNVEARRCDNLNAVKFDDVSDSRSLPVEISSASFPRKVQLPRNAEAVIQPAKAPLERLHPGTSGKVWLSSFCMELDFAFYFNRDSEG